MFLAWFIILSKVEQLLYGNLAKIVIYNQARENDETNYPYTTQCLVPKLVYIFKVVCLCGCSISTQEPQNRFVISGKSVEPRECS